MAPHQAPASGWCDEVALTPARNAALADHRAHQLDGLFAVVNRIGAEAEIFVILREDEAGANF